jgi:lactate dehydrogenase-like 2-hydroxyacid dehydrogenase
VTIAATQTFPGPAWDELPEVTVLETWPPKEELPGVEVLLEAVVPVGPAELELLPDLRLVGNYGVGYDNVDTVACGERGIAVTNTPGVLDAAVAELTIALMLACRRQLVVADRFVRDGRWRTGSDTTSPGPRSAWSGWDGSAPRSRGERRRSACASSTTGGATDCRSTSCYAPPRSSRSTCR